jgi:hypothetical protein
MALKNNYPDECREPPEVIADAYYRIMSIVIRESTCTFVLGCWKSRAKFLAGGKPLEREIRVSKINELGEAIPMIIDKTVSKSIWRIIYEYIKTIPGWETSLDAN